MSRLRQRIETHSACHGTKSPRNDSQRASSSVMRRRASFLAFRGKIGMLSTMMVCYVRAKRCTQPSRQRRNRRATHEFRSERDVICWAQSLLAQLFEREPRDTIPGPRHLELASVHAQFSRNAGKLFSLASDDPIEGGFVVFFFPLDVPRSRASPPPLPSLFRAEVARRFGVCLARERFLRAGDESVVVRGDEFDHGRAIRKRREKRRQSRALNTLFVQVYA